MKTEYCKKNNFFRTNGIFSEKRAIILFVCSIFILLNMNDVLSVEKDEMVELGDESNEERVVEEEETRNFSSDTTNTISAEDIQIKQEEETVDATETIESDDDMEIDRKLTVETEEQNSDVVDSTVEINQAENDAVPNGNDLEKTIGVEGYTEDQQPISSMFSETPRRSVAPRANTKQLSPSQKAQLKMISYINNNVDKVRYANNKRLNTNIQNSFKNNVGNVNDSVWYSINMDMSNDRDNLTKSSNGSTLLNFGYNFNCIDNIDSSIAVSFNQTKSDLKMYSKDIPVNTYDFVLSLFNKYDFGSDIVLSSMLSYNYNVVKDRRTKNIEYGYTDEVSGYTISNFIKPVHKRHYNDLALSLSALYNYNIFNNVKFTSEIVADYFTTHKLHNVLMLSPMFEVGSIDGFYHNTLFPVIYVKYNINTNTKKIQVSDTKKVNLNKNNVEYGIRTKIGLNDVANVLFTYSGDSNKNNSISANVGIEF